MTGSTTRLVGAAELTQPEALQLLRCGSLEPEGRLAEASNITMRAFVSADGRRARCVYKPVRGERPLWDFPDGTLAGREVAAYLVSSATGWGIVPPTLLREGPAGPGACQLWIDGGEADQLLGFVPADDLPRDWYSIASARDADGQRFVLAHSPDVSLQRMAAFDVVINNADRKGAHVVRGADRHVYGVDHGVSFHTDDKLRTVLWGWAGRELPADIISTLTAVRGALSGELGEQLAEHLTLREVEATRRRVDRLLEAGRFPQPGDEWPALPWPPI